MANIPVERTGTGTPWWLWLLGLLLLALLLWFLIGAFDDDDADDVVVTDDVEMMDDDVSTAGTLDGAASGAAAQAMDLSALVVTRVAGDRSFYVAPEAGSADETLVLLDQTMSPDVPGVEGQVDVNAGQTVDLSDGTLEPFGDADVLELGLSDADANALTPDTQVIRIDGGDVEISNAELETVEVE